MRDDREVDVEADKAAEAAHNFSKWPNMTYEEGVSAALDWVLENRDEKPLDG